MDLVTTGKWSREIARKIASKEFGYNRVTLRKTNLEGCYVILKDNSFILGYVSNTLKDGKEIPLMRMGVKISVGYLLTEESGKKQNLLTHLDKDFKPPKGREKVGFEKLLGKTIKRTFPNGGYELFLVTDFSYCPVKGQSIRILSKLFYREELLSEFTLPDGGTLNEFI